IGRVCRETGLLKKKTEQEVARVLPVTFLFAPPATGLGTLKLKEGGFLSVTGQTIRARRVAAGISGSVLCLKAGIGRNRLFSIDRSYVQPSVDELARLETALEELTAARKRLDQVASEVGWPSLSLTLG